MANFLEDYESADARAQLQVRCAVPGHDPDISVEANGAFIAHRGERDTAKHLCFSASTVYNSWVCYWTSPGAAEPELSFVQLNAD